MLDTICGRVVDQRRMLVLLRAANRGKRVDGRRTWDAIVVAMVRRADWQTGAITASHATIGADAAAAIGRAKPYSHDTVGRVVEDAEAAGVLVCPEGLGGKSRRATGTGYNQAPTYFILDPDAPSDADAPSGAELRTPHSHASESVTGGATTSLDKGRPKFADFDPLVVPLTPSHRQLAADWVRARLLIGVVPRARLAGMLRQHFDSGVSPWQVARRACQAPDGTIDPPLPIGDAAASALLKSPHRAAADMLLAIVGWRLARYRDVPPPQRMAPATPSVALPPRRTEPGVGALADFAASGLRVGKLRAATSPLVNGESLVSRNSKARRDARKKRRPPVQAQLQLVDYRSLSDAERLRRLGVAESRPAEVKEWILSTGSPQRYLRWAIGYLALWDGNEVDDDLYLTAKDIVLEYLSHDAQGHPLTDAQIDELQHWTLQQCVEFAQQAHGRAWLDG